MIRCIRQQLLLGCLKRHSIRRLAEQTRPTRAKSFRHFTKTAQQQTTPSHQRSYDDVICTAKRSGNIRSKAKAGLMTMLPVVTIHEKRLIPIITSSSTNGTTEVPYGDDGGYGDSDSDSDARRSGRGRPISIPLTVTDFHLRHEQLPFAYFFRETLDIEELASSLQRVLAFYPIVGGSIDLSGVEGGGGGGGGVYIQCQANGEYDTIPLSVGKTDVPLAYWLGEVGEATATSTTHDGSNATGDDGKNSDMDVMGHVHKSGTGHPTLLPLFDPLFSPASSSASSDRNSHFQNLITVRITHCTDEAGGGTIIGVNINHVLADAASCVRLVECWGREMRRDIHHSIPRGASNDRSSATCSGMMSQELMDLMGVERGGAEVIGGNFFPDFATDYYDSAVAYCGDAILTARETMLGAEEEPEEKVMTKSNDGEGKQCLSSSMKHEYIHLPFPPATLDAMKAHGMMQSSKADHMSEDIIRNSPGFVSTNDMVTAVGWLMKKQLSGETDWNMSMIVNLRGRCGVDDFTKVDSLEHNINNKRTKSNSSDGEQGKSQQSLSSSSKGVFGNGITNVVAYLPRGSTGICPVSTSVESRHNNIVVVSSAAISIRNALAIGFDEAPNRIAHSRIGRVLQQSPVSSEEFSSGIFSTTSWGAFSSLWDIRFSPLAAGQLMGFHAHPSHPLPYGQTFSSVIVPTKNGGFVYKLFLPSHLAKEAKELHRDLCSSFINWHDNT